MKRDEEQLSALRSGNQEQPLESLRAMRTAVPVEDPEAVAARRARLVPSLESQIIAESAARHRRARLRRALGVATIAACIPLALAVGLTLRQHAQEAHLTHAASASKGAQGATPAPTNDGAALQGAGAHLVQAAGATLHVHGQPEQTLGASASAGLALSPGAELRTQPSGWLELELPSRARVEMSESSSLSLDAIAAFSQELSLPRGRIDVSVPKPQPGAVHRLLIVTPDSEVEVRGTVFSVEVKPSSAEPARLITEVFVSRGIVAVRHAGHEQLVTMGGHFSSDVAPGGEGTRAGASAPRGKNPGAGAATPSARPSPTAASESAAQPSTVRDAAAARAASESPSSDSNDAKARAGDTEEARQNALGQQGRLDQQSTLGQQNRLFEQALAARDRGDLEGAITLFDRLIARYPSSPLLGSVHTERARVLAKLEARDSR